MSSPLRVLVTADVVSRRPTGVAVATKMLVDALRTRDDIAPSVLVHGDSPAADWGVPVVRANWKIPGAPFVFTSHRKLEAFDIVHCSTVRVPFAGTPRGPKLVMTVHDLVPLIAPEHHTAGHRMYFRYLLARSLSRFDAIVTDSEATRDDVIGHLRIQPERVSVVPLFSRWPVESENGTRSEEFVLAVGTIEPRKNLRRVIEAFAKVRRRNPQVRQRLVVAGAAGWGSEDPFSGAGTVGGEIEWRGYVSDADLRDLYRNAAALIYPSLHEGFGLPLLEAMSLGCPVIASNRSSLPEVGGDAVLYVDPEDDDRMAVAMEKILTDESLRAELRSKGLRQASRFSPERMGEDLAGLYRRILAAPEPSL